MADDDLFSAPSMEPKLAPASTPAKQMKVPTKPATPAESSKAFSLEEANEEIASLLTSGKVSQSEVSSLQGLMRDHVALREKVSKLKSLLGRSAKAQREAKLELETVAKKLEFSLKEVERLTQKVEHLANRPSHLDLLNDFETNFDKALLSVGANTATQSGGETTAATPLVHQEQQVVDTMLMQELAESQNRLEKLEHLNSALVSRSAQLEGHTKTLQHEKDQAMQQVDRLQLELRMAVMEAEHANRSMQDKMQSLQEMQMEIDLVTKASMDANVRAVKGQEAARTVQSDRETIAQLNAQVMALQEWALASAESKRLCQERVHILEMKLEAYETKQVPASALKSNSGERLLFQKSSSLVVGAGDVGSAFLELGPDTKLATGERVVLKWKFDLTPAELNVDFNIMKGICKDAQARFRANYLIKNRTVTGGAGGETEGAFAVQNGCTLLWSNEKSWVRPRTIKYELNVMAIKD